MTGNFVFDIDGAMAIAVSYDTEKKEAAIREKFGPAFFERHRLIAYGYPHFIFPGYYALFRRLHFRGARLFFFSSGIEERNVELIDKMMEQAFGPKSEHPEYQVFSRQHCIDTDLLKWEDKEVDEKYQSFFYGQRKKKLGGIVVPEEEVPNTLLIDDDTSYMVKGEEHNFVYVPYTYEYLPDNHWPGDGFRRFHKAFYLAGLFNKISEVREARNISLAEAAKVVQIDMEGGELSRGFYYPGTKRMDYYKEGLQLLREIEGELGFYVEGEGWQEWGVE